MSTKLGSTVEDALQYLQPTIQPIPTPKSREIIVKVKVAALNFFDGLILQGKYQMPIKPPFIPLTEFSGIIIKVGSKIKNYKIGDRVIGSPKPGYGVLSEYSVMTERNIFKMPNNMSYEDGASFYVTYGTSYMALIQRANINKSTNLLVTAASGINKYIFILCINIINILYFMC